MRLLLTSGLVLAFSMAQAWGQNTTCTDPDACNYNANESGPCLYYTASDVTACAGDETTLEVTNLSVDPVGAPSSVIQAGNVSHAPFFVEDAEGALYVAAAFEGSHTVFGQTLTSTGEDDMYLAKLNAEGDLMWLIQGLADRDVNVGDLALMPDGGVTVVGTHLAAASWFGENGTNYSASFTSSYNSGHRDGYSIRVNGEGEIVWGLTLTGGSNEGLNGVVSDSEGNAIITGGFNGCCPSYFIAYLNGEENEVTVESFGINYGTGVLTKISPQGEVLWTNTCHNRDVGLRPVGTDADGNVYLSSNFRSWNNGTGMIHIDATGTQHTVSNPGIGRAFLLQVDGNGIWQWGRSFGNLGSGPSAAIYVADMDVVDNDVRVVGSYFAGEVDFEGGDVVLPSSSHYRGYAAVYDLTGDLVQAADFDLSDGGFNASAMGTAGGQDWLAGSFETGSNAPANEGGRDALWCSIDWSDLSLGEPQTFGGPDSDDISYLGEEQGRLAVGGFVTGSATSDNLQGEGGGLIYALGSEPLDVLVTWEDGTEGAVLPWTASETESVSFNVVAGNAICEGSILVSVPENECADPEACNFNPEHSCYTACVFPLIENDCGAGAVACAAGTVWDAESQTCVVATLPYLNEPGEIAELNPCYFDTNYNGLVDVTDLMNLLSVYNTSCDWEE
ncbi:MAG: hypothetical protein VX190_07155 [Bacteroidota bacterium]|nr:hypothetical protein [Bacteroidota bacterium]